MTDSFNKMMSDCLESFRDLRDQSALPGGPPEAVLDRFIKLHERVFEELVWDPGKVIHVADFEDAEETSRLIKMFWHSLENEERLLEVMLEGGYSGIIANIIGEYVERLKMVHPIVVSIDPQEYNFATFYSEAIHAWLFGAGRAAVGLCASILEEVLFGELAKSDRSIALTLHFDGETVNGISSSTLNELISLAKANGLLSWENAALAHNIRTLRNDILHDLKSVEDKTTLQALEDTRIIIESMLSPSSSW